MSKSAPEKPDTVQRQSVAWIDWMQTADATKQQSVVVVGSGYGGAVAALRYAEKGYAVTVLERGAEFLPGEFSNDMSTLPKFLRAPDVMGKRTTGSATGLFDFRPGLGATAVVANGLGGGSLINAGVAIEPNPAVLTQSCWPQAIRADALNLPSSDAHSLRKAYDLAHLTLGATLWSPATTGKQDKPKTDALNALANSLGVAGEFRYPHLTINPQRCTNCGDCASGCNVPGAKLTLAQTYLAKAMATGRVRIITRATVLRLAPERCKEPTTHWVLRVLPTEEIGFWPSRSDADRQAGSDLHATQVVLSAGTFGSTEILQRSKAHLGEDFAISPSLGSRFSANGDNISFLADTPKPVLATGQGVHAGLNLPDVAPCGPTITGMIDLRHNAPTAVKGGPGLEHEILVQDGAIPGAIARLFKEALSTAYTARQLSNWRWRFAKSAKPQHDPLAASQELADHTQVLLTMGHDQAVGSIVRVEGRDESVPFWPNAADAPGYVAQQKLFDRIPKKQGVHIHMPTWRFFGSNVALDRLALMPPMVTTVHPLGGCAMGDYFETSVVNDQGLVRFGERRTYKNLRVLDASIIPTSLGANPFLTITALAERAMTFVSALDQSEVLPATHRPIIPTPEAPQYQSQPISASITEVLNCEEFTLRYALAQDLGFANGAAVNARFEFETQDADWLALWDDKSHTVTALKGQLTLTDSEGTCCTWKLEKGKGTLPLLPAGKRAGALRHAIAFVRCVLTWWFIRYSFTSAKDDSRPAAIFPEGDWVTRTTLWIRNFFAGALTLWHASEERDMHYSATLVDMSGHARKLPDLKLVGTKHVAYAATWMQLLRWDYRRFKFKYSISNERPTRFNLRDSFWEQVTNPEIELYPAFSDGELFDCRLGSGKFQMDIPNLIKGGWFDSAPLMLKGVNDLSSGLQALAAYPALFARFALKTRVAEVRFPDYGHEVVDDAATAGQVKLRVLSMGDMQPTLPDVHPQKYVLTVPRGETTVDEQMGELPDRLTLALWRYRRPGNEHGRPEIQEANWNGVPVRKVKSILLLHAFGQSGYTFTTKSMPGKNMAEAFYEAGWEVWILDHRISTRLGYAELPSTIDQVGQIDVPAAVDKILFELRSEIDGDQASNTAPLQIHAFAQCIGAAGLAAGLLSGSLHHDISRPSFHVKPKTLDDKDTEEAQNGQLSWLPKLASAVISQTHPFLVGSKITQAKTWVPGLIRSAFKRFYVPFAVREPVHSMVERAVDTLFASLPVPAEERCPSETDYKLYESACVTCKRIRFIEAPLYKHSNLSTQTHEELPLLFGPANVHLFAQASRMVKQERLCSEDGFNVYASVTNLRKYAALPIVFMHGLENELFDAESAQRSAKRHFDAHPQWATLAANALPTATTDGKLGSRVMDIESVAGDYNYWWIKGYGHLDPIIGKKADEHVFVPLCNWFDQMQSTTGAGLTPPTVAPCVIAKPPRCGPFMSNVRTDEDKVTLTVTFLIDDLHHFANDSRNWQIPGQRVWPIAAVQGGASIGLQIRPYVANLNFFEDIRNAANLDDPGGHAGYVPHADYQTYSMACGDIEIPKILWSSSTDVMIDCFTVHETLTNTGIPLGVLISIDMPKIADLNQAVSLGVSLKPATQAYCAHLLATALLPHRKPAKDRRPTISALRNQVPEPADVQLRLRKSAWQAVDQSSNTLTFAATCCRYPGYGVDALRAKEFADKDFRKIIQDEDPAFALMVGDQIYADATGGLVDPLSPIERFFEKHLQAFGRSEGMGDFLAQMPTYMTPDDHEFIESYPNSRPMTMLATRRQLIGSDHADTAARDALEAFQLLQQPNRIGTSDSYTFNHGPARFFVLDTRTERTEEWVLGPLQRQPSRLLSADTLTELQAWLADPEALKQLNCLVTGSVLVPGLVPDGNPAYAGRPDNWQGYASERATLMGELSALSSRGGKFLLLSGDYHISAACGIFDSAKPDKQIGAAIVVPPLYSPLTFLNASRQDIWMTETPRYSLTASWTLKPLVPTQAGSGLAKISVTRNEALKAPPSYEIQLAASLRVWEESRDDVQWGCAINI